MFHLGISRFFVTSSHNTFSAREKSILIPSQSVISATFLSGNPHCNVVESWIPERIIRGPESYQSSASSYSPLTKGGKGGFVCENQEQIPLNPPFRKGDLMGT